MKKVLLVAFVAGLAMASCKKEYTCECSITTYINGVASTQTQSGKTEKMKKADAEAKCNTGDITSGDTQNGMKASCEIK